MNWLHSAFVFFLTPFLSALLLSSSTFASASGPYDAAIEKSLRMLDSKVDSQRVAALEQLGYLRAWRAEAKMVTYLEDDSAEVRRAAAMALGWCGSRQSIGPLVELLEDADWLVRQAAFVSLENLTAMRLPFHTAALPSQRTKQAAAWRAWWHGVQDERVPRALTDTLPEMSPGMRISASSTYKGPPAVLVDGQIGPAYWQTKAVKPPQWITFDLGTVREVGQVKVHQYSSDFVMLEYEIATSLDGETFTTAVRRKGETPVVLAAEFRERKARFVRIISYGSKTPLYPTTFYEVEIGDLFNFNFNFNLQPQTESQPSHAALLRAIGALGDKSNVAQIVSHLGPVPSFAAQHREAGHAGIRALGRLGGEDAFQYLVTLLRDINWARYAAEALGDIGDPRAIGPILDAYPGFSRNDKGQYVKERVPRDDYWTFPNEDRMLETPYLMMHALSRLAWDNPHDRDQLRALGPVMIANIRGDHDTFFIYELEVGDRMTRYLLDVAGLREEVVEWAFRQCGASQGNPLSQPWPDFAAPRAASILPSCAAPSDVPRLLELMSHKDGWVRLNAAKAIGVLGDRSAIQPLSRILEASRPEAEFGYSGTFKHEEYNDPAPRWREGVIRALGKLAAQESVPLIVNILDDPRNVMDIRLAAAEALGEIGSPEALEALRRAASGHDFLSVRQRARDALRFRGSDIKPPASPIRSPRGVVDPPWSEMPRSLVEVPSIVFVQGSSDIPNTKGTVEQQDRWRQTYVVTDSGPCYRPGRNLMILTPPKPDGTLTRLTRFPDGYVAEPEVSWDGRRVIFCHRGQDNPWWHIWEVHVDGSGLRQITDGPYHFVGPAYLPDGRIVCATSQLGIRDEYHGYPSTALMTMNADGSGREIIATNIGRDNEPTILDDGRIAFSRLEVFYSRNKTEQGLHATFPDGTGDVVLYGPERRRFWRTLDHGPRGPDDGQEAPLTHRVLRMTAPVQMPGGGIVCATQAGLALIGPRRTSETLLMPDYRTRAYTTPSPLPDGTILCAMTEKVSRREDVDLGVYLFDPKTKRLTLVYNDPQHAEFEARAVMPRRRPPIRPPSTKPGAYTGKMLCASVFVTQEPEVLARGRFVRLNEGLPVIGRHSTQTNRYEVWQNHGGTLGRVLGTIPLAPDGSFNVEVPADRLLQFQVLDTDRRVVGNQLTWIYARPGERKSCVGCHEKPHTTGSLAIPIASRFPAVKMLPASNDFRYRAKAWMKGNLPVEIEERMRTVRAIDIPGRR